MNKIEHLLTCLTEECSEVQQAVAKAQRFGLNDGYPGTSSTNADDIIREFNETIAVMELLVEEGVLMYRIDHDVIKRKKARVREYIEYARQRNTLVDDAT